MTASQQWVTSYGPVLNVLIPRLKPTLRSRILWVRRDCLPEKSWDTAVIPIDGKSVFQAHQQDSWLLDMVTGCQLEKCSFQDVGRFIRQLSWAEMGNLNATLSHPTEAGRVLACVCVTVLFMGLQKYSGYIPFPSCTTDLDVFFSRLNSHKEAGLLWKEATAGGPTTTAKI